MSKFFVSCPLGFEQELVEEMRRFWFEMMDLDGQPTRTTLTDFEVIDGGVEIETAEHLGFQINFFSKLANRVLLRIHKFEARYFDQFEKEFKKLDLEKWLEPQNLNLKIEAHKSRINNQKSIEESLTKLLVEKKFKVIKKLDGEGDVDEAGPAQLMYIRNDKDRVTISLDTSGEHLHKRGYALHRGEAPLREVFANYLFKLLKKNAGSVKDLTVIDPFVGSGTILFEAQADGSALLGRSFSWLNFKNRPKLFKSETWRQNYKWLQALPKIECVGIDEDLKSIDNLEKNQQTFNQIFPLVRSDIETICADSLNLDLTPLKSAQNAWLITNPPYGHRLRAGSAIDVLERFESELDLKGMIVLHPHTWNLTFKKLKLVSKIDFKNQGLRLNIAVYTA